MNVNKSLLAVLSIFLILLVFVSSASAADSNATDVLSVDESVNLENNTNILSVDNNAVESNENILKENTGTFSDLMTEIQNATQAGEVTLSKDVYRYDGNGETIVISTLGFIINGNDAIIDMSGSDFKAFKIKSSYVTIKNLTIKNAKVNPTNGATIEFEYNIKNCSVENCNFY